MASEGNTLSHREAREAKQFLHFPKPARNSSHPIFDIWRRVFLECGFELCAHTPSQVPRGIRSNGSYAFGQSFERMT